MREKQLRLNQDGKLYDIPVTSDQERYSEKQTTSPELATSRDRLQSILNEFQSIQPEFKTKGDKKRKRLKTSKEKQP